MFRPLLFAGALLSGLSLTQESSGSGGPVGEGPAGYRCKCGPADACWPKAQEWAQLNQTVEGTLRAVVPVGSSCYRSGFQGVQTYDQAKCAVVSANWANETWQTDQQVTNLWPLWTNVTCDPAQPPPGSPPDPNAPTPTPDCTIGFLPRYVILATKVAHLQAGLKFAKQKNIRLIVRNTGHDFLGRSTGWGSLAINTHSFKSVQFVKNYTGPSEDNWKGGAVKVGSGVQTRELYTKAFAQNPKVVVVGGECPTVGISGGYVQGGGHGPLSTIHGMGADNALEFEVITADGNLRTANSKTNPDLFWALRGGGPSTFGLVVSVTFKTFPENIAAAATLEIAGNTTNLDPFWAAVSAFNKRTNDYVDRGMFVYYEILGPALRVKPFVAPGMTQAQLDTFLQPLWTELDGIGIPYTKTTSAFPTFFELYLASFEDEFAGGSALTGGRIFTRQDIANNNTGIIEAYKKAVFPQVPNPPLFSGIVGHIVSPGKAKPTVNNAIHPVWRQATSFSIVTLLTTPADRPHAQDLLTNYMNKALREAAPNGGAYVNEGDLEEPNWQQAFWGSNYPRLKQLKQQYDPDGLFYARTTPGTEKWEVIQGNTRLCRKL